jgi:hypothetical protein
MLWDVGGVYILIQYSHRIFYHVTNYRNRKINYSSYSMVQGGSIKWLPLNFEEASSP